MRHCGFFYAKEHDDTIASLAALSPSLVIIEQIKNYGMPMSDFVLETCRVSGALEAFCKLGDLPVAQAPRKTVVTGLCGVATAKDSNVKSFLLDYFRPHYPEASGGGKEPLVGTKARPGPFFAFRGEANNDLWAAAAVAVFGVLKWDIF